MSPAGAAVDGGAGVLRPAPGDAVVHEGDAGDAMYRVVRGRVAVRKTDGERTITLATLGPGETFGEMSLFGASHRRSASVVALDDGTELERIDPEEFKCRLAADPRTALADLERLITSLSDRLAHTNASLVALLRMGQHCASAATWDDVARNLVASLRLAVPALSEPYGRSAEPSAEPSAHPLGASPAGPPAGRSAGPSLARATFWRHNPFTEEADLLACAGNSADAVGNLDPASVRTAVRADTAEGCHLLLESTADAAFSPDDQALLETAAALAAGALRRLAAADAEAAQARLAAHRGEPLGRWRR